MSRRLLSAALAVAVLAAGCASSNKPKPAPLESFTAQLAARPLWNTSVGTLNFALTPALSGNTLVLAGSDGQVLALAADSGRELWRAGAGAPLSAGVGSDGRFASVVTRDNELLTFEAGKLLWRQRLGSRIVTAPLVAGERVFVLGLDRAVQAFDAIDGRLLWKLQRPGEPLTLLQPGVLAPFKDTLLVGLGPRLVGVDPLQGTVRWEVPIALPRGSNEVERLADLVGPVQRTGDVVCARAFQAAVGCVDAERGALLWAKNANGTAPLGGDARQVFGADTSDRISAWNAASGEPAWTSDKLLNRDLSGALVLERAVVFGDAEGYVHFLSRDGGRTLQRLPTDGSPILGKPLRAGDAVVVLTRKGGVFAFRPE
ncbi:outer membrane protein assembly factor BamB [Azohydromonas caseinilytica]|uniref:Outer membrane protein assembly factor BamB n=1 Tax=Azohydromonas caseinilytica TaxID=2728836 RepID=A0A848F7P9_9BURK|nr:outer membrane protein assembly factor BamB [Azohydromonas caseinilytica]NML14280.1 outer membrane protein assembly factor BamB [Azohydromonas caseinilytica]